MKSILLYCLLIGILIFFQHDFLYGKISNHHSLLSELEKYSLPSDPVTDDDLPGIRNNIQQALYLIQTTLYYNKKKSLKENPKTDTSQGIKNRNKNHHQPLINSLVFLQHWLDRQECVKRTLMPFAFASEEYAARILTSYPAQINIGIIFKRKDALIKKDQLLLYIASPALIQPVKNNK